MLLVIYIETPRLVRASLQREGNVGKHEGRGTRALSNAHWRYGIYNILSPTSPPPPIDINITDVFYLFSHFKLSQNQNNQL